MINVQNSEKTGLIILNLDLINKLNHLLKKNNL